MKNYIRQFIKSRLPFFIIIFAILLIVAFCSASATSFIEKYPMDTSNGFTVDSPEDLGLAYLPFTVCIICMLLPFFNMSYRYSLAKYDVYSQVAQSSKKFRYVDHGISLGFILASYTIAFIAYVVTIAIRNQLQPVPEIAGYECYKIYLNYAPFLLVYLMTLAFAAGNYFITYLLISRSNSLLNSIVLLIFGQLFLASFCVLFAEMGGTNENYFMLNPCANASISFGPTFIDTRYTYWIIQGDSSYTYAVHQRYWSPGETEALLTTVSSFVVFFLVALIGLITFFFEKDPSGEYAGKPETNNIYQDLFYHASVGSLGTLIFYQYLKYWNDGTGVTLVLFFALFAAVYYVVYGLLRRNFKLKGHQIGTLLANTALVIIMGIIIFACNGFKPH